MDFLAAFLTLLCVILLMRKNVLGWPMAILASIYYFLVFYEVDLYGQMSLQIIYIAQSFYGWHLWKKDVGDDLKIRKINFNEIRYGTLFIFAFGIIFFLLVNPVEPIIGAFDAVITGLALLANYLLAKKVIQSWYLWAFVDLLSVMLFLAHGLYWSVMLYIILMVIASNTYISWSKDYGKTI
jgi:nicotinamide mononucleotide transporter